jgi:hypothetical protein
MEAPGVDIVSKAETVRVDDGLVSKIRQAVDAQKRRNPNLSSFKRAGRKIFP